MAKAVASSNKKNASPVHKKVKNPRMPTSGSDREFRRLRVPSKKTSEAQLQRSSVKRRPVKTERPTKTSRSSKAVKRRGSARHRVPAKKAKSDSDDDVPISSHAEVQKMRARAVIDPATGRACAIPT
uniref:Neurofilament triplet H1-like protein n=1 Tax=Panagrellus redivivus TaxID=6233 RepID=A0A7E4V057_PANRE